VKSDLARARVLAVIPARHASRRFPGKPLADLGGKPIVQHVFERAALATRLDAVVVATDDPRILETVRSFGGLAVLTSPLHRSGTERVAEVVRGLPQVEVVVNVQGDEPFLEPAAIDALVAPLCTEGGPSFTTLREPLDETRDLFDPNVVKVVTDLAGHALYFSRAPIPHRNGRLPCSVHRHVGLYGFRRQALLWYAGLPHTPLEGSEGLEQLRILEHGGRIFVVESPFRTLSIDTPADLERAQRRLQRLGDKP
jgi:3-deoxy-manno-octulosonate cytidylyltransferase (CMP-KDO synthetase)